MRMQTGWFGMRWFRNYPNVFVLETTNRCNLKCRMCPSHGFPEIRTREEGDMPLERFCEIIAGISRFVRNKRFPHAFIVPQGAGEPFLHPDFLSMLESIKNHSNLKFGFMTNGLLLDKNLSHRLLDLKPDEVGFSIHGFDRESYLENTAVDGWSTVMENLKYFSSQARKNQKKVPFIRVQTMDFDYSKKKNFIDIPLQYADELVLQTIRSSSGRQYDLPSSEKKATRKPCHRIVSPLTIGWNRDVYLCCEDWHGEKILGNLDEISLERVLERRREYIKLHRRGKYDDISLCRDCDCWREPSVKISKPGGMEIIQSPLWKRIRKS